MEEMNKMMLCRLTKNEIMRSLAKSMRMVEENISPQSFKKILERNYFKFRFLRKNLNFPNDEESSWEEVKSWKAEEKHKTTLKNP